MRRIFSCQTMVKQLLARCPIKRILSVEAVDAGYNFIGKAAPVINVLIEYIEIELNFKRRKIRDFCCYNQLARKAFFAGKSLTIFIFQTIKNNSKCLNCSPRKCEVSAGQLSRNNFINLLPVIANRPILDT